MNIWLMSDLHTEFEPFSLAMPDPRPDVLVLAGDISTPVSAAVAWAKRHASVPVVLISGNHEFYGVDMDAERRLGAQLAREAGVHLLDEDAVILDGVRFLGCTLWTDYGLDGDPTLAMRHAEFGLMDHQMIRQGSHRFTPHGALALHRRSLAWLQGMLAERFDGPTVVVTHHAPTPRSISLRFTGSPLNTAFASDLTDLIARHQPDLWIHGHVHSNCDYRIGRTRVVCNPRCYASGERAENPCFDPQLVIGLER